MMSGTGRKPWQVLSNVLLAVGGIGFSALLLWNFGLISYYSAKRPYTPSPERGWTVRLQWTHGAYGTLEENEQMLPLHSWAIPFIFVAFVGAAIRQVNAKNEPWRKKQF
jgi:hypothetical protein